MPKSNRKTSDVAFVQRHRDIVLLIAIIIISLVITTTFRISYIGRLAPLTVLQQGFITLSDLVQQIGQREEQVNAINAEYEQLLRNINIYDYSVQTSGYSQFSEQRLQEARSFSSTLAFDHVIARIIARDPNRIFRAFTIDKGAKHGLAIDMPVLAIQDGRSGLVGRVVHVANSSAIVESIIDERSVVVAEHAESQLSGTMRGASFNKQLLTLDFIDAREIDRVRSGDLVITSRFSSIYPPHIPVGTIQPFQRARNSDQATIDVLPILNFNRLNYLFILLPNEIFSESPK